MDSKCIRTFGAGRVRMKAGPMKLTGKPMRDPRRNAPHLSATRYPQSFIHRLR
jgi:hypothetical protein